MPNYYADERYGVMNENYAKSFFSTPFEDKPYRQVGDLRTMGIDLEAKWDMKYAETGNVCGELFDVIFKEKEPTNLFFTGVIKNSTQAGKRLVLHRLGLGDSWVVYQPILQLGKLYDLFQRRPGELTLKMWRNNDNPNSYTGGFIFRPGHVKGVSCKSHALEEVVRNWDWDAESRVLDVPRAIEIGKEFVSPHVSAHRFLVRC